ncbi:MAG: hypothetical protein K940chlam2_01147, partial [Chlamydiae bacterium]|nr:hypothetical protein [Chlamydiota bacterium]
IGAMQAEAKIGILAKGKTNFGSLLGIKPSRDRIRFILISGKNDTNCSDLFTHKIALDLANCLSVSCDLRASFCAKISLQFMPFFPEISISQPDQPLH